MMQWFNDISGASSYYQHAICLTNDPYIMALYVLGDLTTFVAYMIIGGTLLMRRIYTVRLSTAALSLYGAFIVLCGLSHLTKTMTLFTGIYRIDVMVVIAMATVSAITAVYTLRETVGYVDGGVLIEK